VTNFFRGGALLPSGNVVFAPGTSANVGMFDPVALTYSNSVATGTSGIAFSGATLLPNGQVVFTPYDSANVGVIDTFAPVSQEFCLSPYFNKF
jgi:streptogramin lyase